MDKVIKPVLWTTRATKDLKKITFFYIDLYGKEKAWQIATDIRKFAKILETDKANLMEIGMVDESLAHLKRKYRKIYNHFCKITYRVGIEKTYITRVFDTRQDPKKNK